jgi:uncharacterized membrane protein YhaH (DUF805 family)
MFERLYISIRGRCSRRFYWMFGFIPFVILGAIAGYLARWFRLDPVFLYVFVIPFIWPTLAMQIKRWHDFGQSGWWCLLTFIPIAGLIVGIVVGCIPGTVGENRFGPDPLAGAPARAGAL